MSDAPVIPPLPLLPVAPTTTTTTTTTTAPNTPVQPGLTPAQIITLAAQIVSLPDAPQYPPRLEGRIVSPPQANETEVTIRTALGDVTVKLQTALSFPLPANTPVTVALPQASTGAAAQILIPKASITTPVTTPIAATTTPITTAPLVAGDVITGYRLPHLPLPVPTAPVWQPLPALGAFDIKPVLQNLGDDALPLLQSIAPEADTETLLRLLSAAEPDNIIASLPRSAAQSLLGFMTLISQDRSFTTLPQTTIPQATIPQTTAPQTELPGQKSLPNIVDIKIHSLMQPLKLAGTPTPPAPGLMLAEVEGFTPSGYPVLRMDNHSFVLETEKSLPLQTKIWVQVTGAQNTPPHQPRMTSFSWPDLSAPGAILQSSKWPALQETLDILREQNNALAQTILQSIPAPASARMVPATLFFLAALRSGNIQNWIGADAIDTLTRSNKKEIAARLSKDFQSISQASQSTNEGEWQVISMPTRHDSAITQIQFLVRHPPDEEAKKDAADPFTKKTTRFILNLHLSRMGDVQIDGLIKKKKMDVVLRSENMLPLSMRQDIMRHYADGLAKTGLQGAISFQTRQENWVTP